MSPRFLVMLVMGTIAVLLIAMMISGKWPMSTTKMMSSVNSGDDSSTDNATGNIVAPVIRKGYLQGVVSIKPLTSGPVYAVTFLTSEGEKKTFMSEMIPQALFSYQEKNGVVTLVNAY